jgi:hypothetical protein
VSDTRTHYKLINRRARGLRERVDDAIHALLMVQQAVGEVGNGDMDLPGELWAMEHADLQQCVDAALFSARAAERITNVHVAEVDREMSRLGINSTPAEEAAAP